jgi:y4mF family transcriptional regulator
MCTIMHKNSPAIAVARALGEQVRGRRSELGLDQHELSLVTGVSRRTIHAIEHGKPTVQLAALVSVLRGVGLELSATPRVARRDEPIDP